MALGFYFSRQAPAEAIRPALPATEWHERLKAVFAETGCRSDHNGASRWRVSSDFIANFDLVIVHHDVNFVIENWVALIQVPVVWRTIGQDSAQTEELMRDYRNAGLRIVRWSPVQRELPSYIGADAFVRAAKDPAEWCAWRGSKQRIVTFNNDFLARSHGLSFDFWKECVAEMPVDLFGLRNEGIPEWRGVVSYESQAEILREYRVAFITGSQPAPYTLGFVEAWMTGIPVVSLSRTRGTLAGNGTYELDQLIIHGKNGFLVDSAGDARQILDRLLADYDLAKSISEQARRDATRTFGVHTISAQWRHFLADTLGYNAGWNADYAGQTLEGRGI
jgi:hypothetical protein